VPTTTVSLVRLITRVAAGLTLGTGCIMQGFAVVSSVDPPAVDYRLAAPAAFIAGLLILVGTLIFRPTMIAIGSALGSVWYLSIALIQAIESNAGRGEWIPFTSSLTLFMIYLFLAILNSPPLVTKREDMWSP
jgi:hypothetical protein